MCATSVLGSRGQKLLLSRSVALWNSATFFWRQLKERKKEEEEDDRGGNYVSLFDKFYAKLSFHVRIYMYEWYSLCDVVEKGEGKEKRRIFEWVRLQTQILFSLVFFFLFLFFKCPAVCSRKKNNNDNNNKKKKERKGERKEKKKKTRPNWRNSVFFLSSWCSRRSFLYSLSCSTGA